MRTIWHLFRTRQGEMTRLLLWGLVVGSIRGAMVFSLINGAVAVSQGESAAHWLIGTVVLLALLPITSIRIFNAFTKFFGAFFTQTRSDLVSKSAKLSLRSFEQIRPDLQKVIAERTNAAFSRLKDGVEAISYVFQLLGNAFVVLLVYPPVLLFLAFGGVFIALATYWRRQYVGQPSTQATEAYDRFSHLLGQMLKGFKPLKLDASKSQSLIRSINQELEDFHLAQVEANTRRYHSQSTTELLLFIALLSMLGLYYLFPDTESLSAGLLLLSLMNYSVYLVSLIVGRSDSFAVWDELLAEAHLLAEQIANAQTQTSASSPPQPLTFAHKLRISGLTFAYPGFGGYKIGPIDFELEKGETLFIIGGNGSGKTTFLKALTQLYTPQQAQIELDGQPLTLEDAEPFRNLFSMIPTDFHLFDRLYGQEDVRKGRVNYLIKIMGLEDKVSYDGYRFSTLDLSTGQRKRLAMVNAFIDDRAIYIFDEVAADQDPFHRKFYYETVLADMKKAGKTVIVVSHDEHYFHFADRVLQMKDGLLVRWDSGSAPRPATAKP